MTTGEVRDAVLSFDLEVDSVRELNRRLHEADSVGRVRVLHPGGRHSIAVGLDAPYEVEIEGHVGYYCAGMNQQATVRRARQLRRRRGREHDVGPGDRRGHGQPVGRAPPLAAACW